MRGLHQNEHRGRRRAARRREDRPLCAVTSRPQPPRTGSSRHGCGRKFKAALSAPLLADKGLGVDPAFTLRGRGEDKQFNHRRLANISRPALARGSTTPSNDFLRPGCPGRLAALCSKKSTLNSRRWRKADDRSADKRCTSSSRENGQLAHRPSAPSRVIKRRPLQQTWPALLCGAALPGTVHRSDSPQRGPRRCRP